MIKDDKGMLTDKEYIEYMAKLHYKKPRVLVTEKKYQGKYVAFGSLKSRSILASGSNAGRVIAAAKRKGTPEPVIVFVPSQDVAYLY